jgi:hypothetical protein
MSLSLSYRSATLSLTLWVVLGWAQWTHRALVDFRLELLPPHVEHLEGSLGHLIGFCNCMRQGEVSGQEGKFHSKHAAGRGRQR